MAVVEAFDDIPGAKLFPDEETAIRNAGEKRRREFAIGRHCARRALSSLGVVLQPILPGPHREPVWPPGIVGSITHCSGYCAAAVARRRDCATIGIDAEVHGPLPEGVLASVALDQEKAWLNKQSPDGIQWDCVLFSAKESVYKAWFPLTGAWLDFPDAMVTIDADAQSFIARLLVGGLNVDGAVIHELTGRFCVTKGLVLTAVSLAARPE